MYAIKIQKILLCAAGIFLVLFYSHTASADWTILTLDSNDVGDYTSIALDSSDNPRISYHKSVGTELKYTWCDADCADTSNWTNITIDGTGVNDAGRHSSLALDSSDAPRISYYDVTTVNDGDLKYASCDTGCGTPGNWTKEFVASADDVGWDNSLALALDVNNTPHISYKDKDKRSLEYAYFDGSIWQVETVDDHASFDIGVYTSLALDSSGNPHISYYHRTFGDLRYAYHNGTSWLITTVDGSACDGSGNTCHDDSDCPAGQTCFRTVSDVGEYTSLALDSSDRPRISYYNSSDGNLKYASCDTGCEDPGNWVAETVDSAGDVGVDSSLALDNSGTPHISYYNWGNALKYATYDGGSGWQTETVDSAGDVGEYTSIAVDSSGNPHISYHDYDNKNLKYATFADPCLVDADCNDNNVCTDDTCNVGTGECIFTPNSGPCDDGLFCTETDQCSGGACAGSGEPCDVSQVCDEGTDMCYDDTDADGVFDNEDNCVATPNPGQEDTSPPQGNGIGDACDCEADFNCDGNVDATDVDSFLADFGRSVFSNPCTKAAPCNGDFDCNVNVDAQDVDKFLEDFGRSMFSNPCPACVMGDWCVYP